MESQNLDNKDNLETLEKSTEGIVINNDILINNNYFNDTKEMKLYIENEKLKNKIFNLEKKNEELEKKVIDLLKSLNELLKLNKSEEQLKELNIDDINSKITSIMYRELRLKHLVPFSPLMGNFGLKNQYSTGKTILFNSDNILKKI